MRKRKINDDIIHNGKKIRLDRIFQDLTLDDKKSETFEINPNIKTFDLKSEDDNTELGYLAEKLMGGYLNTLQQDFKLIKAYNRSYVLYYHFQKWLIRLFNSFAMSYNQANNAKIPRFKTFAKLLRFIEANNFSFHDLLYIINQENAKELKKYNKYPKNSKVTEVDDIDYEEIKYNYWDKIHPESDFVMSEESDVEMSDT